MLLLLDLVKRTHEEQLIDALLNVSILSLLRSEATESALHLSGQAPPEVEVVFGVTVLGFLDSLAVFGVEGGDEGAVGQRFLVEFLFDLHDLIIKLLEDIAESDLLNLLCSNVVSFLFGWGGGVVEEGLDVLVGEGVVGEAGGLAFLDEPDEGVVDEQSSQFVLEAVLAQSGEVEAEDFNQFYLALGLELAHQRHRQVFKLAHDVIAHLLLTLEYLDKVIEVFVNTEREASLLVELIVSLLVVVAAFVDGPQVDFIGDLLLEIFVAQFVRDSQLSALDVLIVHVIDVEILLPVVRVDRVQLEKVLTTNATPESRTRLQQSQHYS